MNLEEEFTACIIDNSLKSIKTVLKQGFNINKRMYNGILPLNLVIVHRRDTIAYYLMEQCNIDLNAQDNFRYDEHESRPVHHAAREGLNDVIRYLVRHRHVNVDSQDAVGCTPLHYAARAGNIGALKTLFSLGANINQVNKYGNTPLWAGMAVPGAYLVTKHLLQAGAHIDLQNRVGTTVLFEVVLQNNIDVLQLLLCHGLNPSIRDIESNTVLHFVSSLGRIGACNLLLEHSTEYPRETQQDGSPQCIIKCDVNAKNEYGNTALHNAAIYNHEHVILRLLNAGADPSLLNRCSKSALYLAMTHMSFEGALLLYRLGSRLTLKEHMFYIQYESRKSDEKEEFHQTLSQSFASVESLYFLAIVKVRCCLKPSVDRAVTKLLIPSKIVKDIKLSKMLQEKYS